MSYYKINGITVNPPVGTVIEYLGTSDPPGWVICDGTARTNNSGIYTNVASKGFGTLSNGMYSPPDLTGSFLLGANGTIGYKSGDANKILNETDMPSHSHPMEHSHLVGRRGTDAQYSYATNYYNRIPNGKVNNNQVFYEQNGAYSSGPYAFYPGSGEGGNVANTTKDYTGNAGNSTPFSIMPSYYVVNYILKY